MTVSIPDNTALFIGPRAKIRRAKRFVTELTNAFEHYRQNEPYSAAYVVESGKPSVLVNWKGIGDDAGAIIGDAIHNMRSALDQAASELARINEESDKDVYFPFSADASSLEDAIKRRRFDKAGADAVDVLRQLAPYRGGNDSLRAIHDLDIMDKHSMLIPTPQIHNLKIKADYDLDDLESGTACIDGLVTFVFDDGTALAGLEIIETLKSLVQAVESALEAFASLVAARA